LNIESIDDILSGSDFQNYSDIVKKEAKNEINPLLEKTKQQQKIVENDAINPDEKLRELAKKIEITTKIEQEDDYRNKLDAFFSD
jgi:hypothetical protein